ncbi:MAG: hypothetical protein QM754_20465 [Tepidisphaeraceae bacterium]
MATTVRHEAPEPPLPDLASGEKRCRVCNKDLKGHRRLKDSRGYICVACDKAERRQDEVADAQDLNLIPCPECGRKLKAEGITTVNGMVMCKTCAVDHKELNKFKAPPPTLGRGKEAEKRRLYIMLGVGGVLLLIILLNRLGLLGGG